MSETLLIPPCGGALVDLMARAEEAEELTARARRLPSVRLTERQACDLELLATGALSPLDRFMGAGDYARVVAEMRLAGGHVFPVPVALSVKRGEPLGPGGEIALRDARNELLALMAVEEVYEWDAAETAARVFGTNDSRHPLVAEMAGWGELNVSGRLRVLRLPRHPDFSRLRLTPAETRARLAGLGRANVVAFQTRNPLHRAHEEMLTRALREEDATLLLHPVVGLTKPGDVDHFTRVRTYRALEENFDDPARILLALLPLAMRMAGPREALWHALIRRNYGANFLIVGRDHASPGKDSAGRPFYGPYDAQELVARFEGELGVRVKPFRELVYVPGAERYEEASRVREREGALSISGTAVREEFLNAGRRLPEWYTRPEVSAILAEAYPPLARQGFCVWFTGLSCAGKSTTAELLTVFLQELGRQVTLLDGDVVRTHLSHGLGFSKEDRDANVRRIGFVASEIVRHGGATVCAAVSPYRAARNEVREMVGRDRFVEVYVSTPLDVCERRDPKGMYERARRGELRNVTGIDDPYEEPHGAELTLETETATPEENARRVLALLAGRGFVKLER